MSGEAWRRHALLATAESAVARMRSAKYLGEIPGALNQVQVALFTYQSELDAVHAPDAASDERERVRISQGKVDEDLMIVHKALDSGRARRMAAAVKRLLAHLEELHADSVRWRAAAGG